MQNGAQAYSENAKATGNSREREASLLIKAAVQLQQIKDAGVEDRTALNHALQYNRKLWTVFLSSVSKDDNPLPQEIRNNIASLAVFILRHTLEVQTRPAAEKLTTLVSINREIAAGLRSQAT